MNAMNPDRILILEDTAARVTEMRPVLARLVPGCEPVVFDNVPDLVDWLPDGLPRTALICLDHDLGPNHARPHGLFDPGIGHDAVDWLPYPPVCPVIIHSTNTVAVPGCCASARESGWPCSAVMPSDDLRWIATDWRAELEWWIAGDWINIAAS